MHGKVIITIIHHSNGEFIVYKNLGGFPYERRHNRFATRDEADTCAKQLQAEHGGPDRAEIVTHDFTP